MGGGGGGGGGGEKKGALGRLRNEQKGKEENMGHMFLEIMARSKRKKDIRTSTEEEKNRLIRRVETKTAAWDRRCPAPLSAENIGKRKISPCELVARQRSFRARGAAAAGTEWRVAGLMLFVPKSA